MNKTTNRLSLPALLAGIFLSWQLSGCSAGDSKKEVSAQPATQDSIRLPAFLVQKGLLTSSLQMPGELTAFQQVDIYAKVNSYVKRLYADVGSQVKAGQLLAELEAPEISSQLEAAASRLKSQEAVYISSKATYDRLLQTSQTPGTIAPNDLDLALAKANSDLALLESARAGYREVSQTRDYLTIRAPFDGVVSLRSVNTGAYVGPAGKGSDQPIFIVQEQKKLRLVISVPEAYTDVISPQSEVRFTVRAIPNHTFRARVTRLAGAVGDRLRSERVEMDVPNLDRKLLPGMAAEVSLSLPARDSTLVIARTALVNAAIKPFVIKVTQGKAHWVEVQAGRSEGDRMEIYGSLSAGDTLIRTASEEIRDGRTVSVVIADKK